jgi:hypothetical protein
MATNPYDKILEKKGLSYSDLTTEEKELYHQAAKGTKAIGLSDLKDHLDEMLYALLLEHCETPDTPEFQDKNKYQKARIKNYAVLQAFMEVPDKVAKAIEQSAGDEE